jgi:RNA polymerase sigma-70 factor, ECF subfamily
VQRPHRQPGEPQRVAAHEPRDAAPALDLDLAGLDPDDRVPPLVGVVGARVTRAEGDDAPDKGVRAHRPYDGSNLENSSPTMSCVATDTHSIGSELDLEPFRRELTGYCYRMLGSGFDAEDAVQETMVRAWRSADRLQERAALKSWLYRIATNVCYDMLQGSQKRARPMDFGPASTAESTLEAPLPEESWVQPLPDASLDPAELTASKETIRLAFVAALQHLPARQRAVLILCEVLRWKASEVAALLDTTTASVNSALQRARATMDELELDVSGPREVDDGEQQELLTRYVDAFERYDVAQLVTLLKDDVVFNMPPFELWLQGPDDVAKWMLGPGIGCKDAKIIVTNANGCPAVAIYKPSEPGVWAPFNLAVLEFGDGEIAGIHNFLYPELFPAFGLPEQLTESSSTT